MKKLIIPMAAGALALTACGGQPDPAVTARAAAVPTTAQPVACGTVPATGGKHAKVLVRQGNVDCAQATAISAQYFARLTPADLANPDGAGPVALDPWTCGSDPGSPLTATCSTEDDREIATSTA